MADKLQVVSNSKLHVAPAWLSDILLDNGKSHVTTSHVTMASHVTTAKVT